MIYDYQIVSNRILEELESVVKGEISAGWQPIGGVAVTSEFKDDRQQFYYMQSLVKYR